MFARPLPTHDASGPSRGGDNLPLIVTPPARGDKGGSPAEAYDPYPHSYRSPSMYSGYTGYESVAGGEGGLDIRYLDGVPLDTVESVSVDSVTRRPVYGRERTGSGSGGDTGGGSAKGKERAKE
jgi:hypothetical protein